MHTTSFKKIDFFTNYASALFAERLPPSATVFSSLSTKLLENRFTTQILGVSIQQRLDIYRLSISGFFWISKKS